MQRLAFRMNLFPGKVDEYKKRHDAIWPVLESLLQDHGISDYFIFLDEHSNALFASYLVDDEEALNELPKDPVMQQWWEYMRDIMETNEDNSPVSIPLKEMFYMP